ncbi:MAG: GNAT family N-acetyltransferase [Candidatus Thorarchaeota archaeon]|jgi:RimJ/RimL family protein N-acetyltransferase
MYYGEKVKLRALDMSDLENIMKGWNNFEMRWQDGSITLAIEDKKNGEFLGTAGIFDINKQTQRAEFGIAIHSPENWGKGYGTDATRVMLWIGFQVLGLNSIYLYTASYNERGQKAYERAGFKRVGEFRQAVFIEGQFHNFIAMDILKDEFLEMYPPGKAVGEA